MSSHKRWVRKAFGGYTYNAGQWDEHYFDYMAEPNYDWNQHSTVWLLGLKNTQLGRDHPVLSKKIREVLATREHVPNIPDRKKIRQAKTKAKRNR